MLKVKELRQLWLKESMDFKETGEDTILIKWSHNYFEDYQKMSYQFYECGYRIFVEVIQDPENNIKSDMWFPVGIFLARQSIELGLKALLCRSCGKNNLIQATFENCKHDVSGLFEKYNDINKEDYLSNEEKRWLVQYLASLEEIDGNSSLFRFPFEDEFLSRYKNEFLDNFQVANNMLQAFNIIQKCIQKGNIDEESKFDNTLKPEFFIFTPDGTGNCWLHQEVSDEGFHVRITGYSGVIDFIYNNKEISKETKFYPLMFMFRNTVELGLKRLFYNGINYGIPLQKFGAKKKSHLIEKELWENVKPIIAQHVHTDNDRKYMNIIEDLICDISLLDKNGDTFRYPTSYSLEYRLDDKCFNLKSVYIHLHDLIDNFCGLDTMLYEKTQNKKD